MRVFMVMLATVAVLLALMANLLLKPKSTTKMATWMGWGANVLGFLLYGYGYAKLESNVLMAVLKTIYAVFGMFLGKNSMGDMQALPFFEYSWVKLLMYLAQMFALYITASAAITVFGTNLLNSIRVLMARFGRICLIYGVDEDTLRVGKEFSKDGTHVVFIGSGAKEEAFRTKIYQMRAVFVTDSAALNGTEKFLKRFGIGSKERDINVLAISKNASKNIAFAESLRSSMKAAKVEPKGTRLTLCLEEGYEASLLQNTAENYGYGSVLDFDMAELSSRMLMLKCPPYKTLSFDENGKAQKNFEVMIVGFGKVGQAALKHLVMNGQFYGSKFRATVFEPAVHDIDGVFQYRYAGLLDHYDITLVPKDGRSIDAFRFLDENAPHLKYIVIATGNDELNQEIGLSYSKTMKDLGQQAVIAEASSSKGTRVWYDEGKFQTETWPLMNKELIDSNAIDQRAKILNQQYMSWNGKTADENWQDCDFFSRESSRASADYMDALIAMSGKTQEEVIKEGWDLSDAQKEVLGRSEHERWIAFHFAHGYNPMSMEEWQERAKLYTEEKKEKGKSKVRIGKNTKGRTHACMIPWEELPALDERENQVTGGQVEYQKMDIDNVLSIPELLRVK